MKKCDYEIREKVAKPFVDDILSLFSIFSSKDINVFARDGLLLGTIRHKGFLPFDSDPDIGILAEDYHTLKNADLGEYELDAGLGGRNIRYYLKTGVPYDFGIYKKREKWVLNMFLVVCFAVTVIFFRRNKVLVVVVFLLFMISVFAINKFIKGKKILDGTAYPRKNNSQYYQEVERGERHVFNRDYGHDEGEDGFVFDKDDILPLVRSQFYHGEVLVPKNSVKILQEHYGSDVFEVMYKKEDANMVKIDISGCVAPPAEIVQI